MRGVKELRVGVVRKSPRTVRNFIKEAKAFGDPCKTDAGSMSLLPAGLQRMLLQRLHSMTDRGVRACKMASRLFSFTCFKSAGKRNSVIEHAYTPLNLKSPLHVTAVKTSDGREITLPTSHSYSREAGTTGISWYMPKI